MFPFIKNKFRFVTVSLLLASLVTVFSSASADVEDYVQFPVTVEAYDCTVNDIPADWSPINATSAQVVNPSETANFVADLRFQHGSTDCLDGSMNTTGYVTSIIEPPLGWTATAECDNLAPRCYANPEDDSIGVSVTVPGELVVNPGGADFNSYAATLYLTWTQ